MRDMASELGVVESVSNLLQKEELEAHVALGMARPAEENKIIMMGIAASYRGEGWS